MELVRRVRYGRSSPNVVLLCQHGGNGNEFLRAFGRFHEACGISQELLGQYLRIEQDVGTTELTHATARALGNRGVCVQVIEARLPRGIIDSNRTREFAFPRIFNKTEFPRLAMNLEGLYDQTTAQFNAAWSSCNPILFLDIHSMSSSSPRQRVVLEPGNIQKHVNAWMDAEWEGTSRSVDLITRDLEGRVLADERLAHALAKGLEREGISYEYNRPYVAVQSVMTTHRLQERPGLPIDFPKNLLADGPLDQMVVDEGRVKRIAEILATAVHARITGAQPSHSPYAAIHA